MSGQNYLFPVHLTLVSMVFTMETQNTSGSFFEMPMTPTLDPAIGTNSVAKRRRQDNLRPLQAWKQVSLPGKSPSVASIPSVESSNSGGNNNTNDSKGKKGSKVRDENNHLYMTIHSCTINARNVFLTVDIVTWHICQSAKFWLKHVGPMRPPPKFGPSEIFANFVPRQKLEVNKIGSSATQPYPLGSRKLLANTLLLTPITQATTKKACSFLSFTCRFRQKNCARTCASPELNFLQLVLLSRLGLHCSRFAPGFRFVIYAFEKPFGTGREV